MPWRSESIDGPGGGEGGLTSPPAPLKDFGYVVNSDVLGGVLLHKAPLGPRPTPMYEPDPGRHPSGSDPEMHTSQMYPFADLHYFISP